MDISTINEVIPIIGRVLIYALVAIYSTSMFRKYDMPNKKLLRSIPYILIARELFALVFFTPVLFYLSDTIVLVVLFWWLGQYIKRLRSIMLIVCITVLLLNFAIAIAYHVDLGVDAHADGHVQGDLHTVADHADLETGIPPNLFLIAANALLILLTLFHTYLTFYITARNLEGTDYIVTYSSFVPAILTVIARVALLFNVSLTVDTENFLFNSITSLSIHLASLSLYFVLIYFYGDYSYKQAQTRAKFSDNYIHAVFGFLHNIASAMINRVKAKEVLDYAIQTTVTLMGAEAGVALLKNEKNELELTSSANYFPPPFEVPESAMIKIETIQEIFKSRPIKPGTTIFGRMMRNNQTVYIRSTIDDGRLRANIQDNLLFINSLIAIPIVVNNESIGVLAIINRSKDKFFTIDIFERTQIFVSFVSLNLESLNAYVQLLEKQEIERDISIAGEIQQKLLPSRLPANITKSIATWSQPLRGVSGDYHDIIPLNNEGKIAVVICDVAGKGVPASLIMVMIRTITHLVASSGQNTAEIIGTINTGVSEKVDVERFATMSYFTYDPVSRRIEYSNAAHHPMLICRSRSGAIEKLDAGGLPVGLESDSKYASVTAELVPGDAIMLYTDGIVEALSPSGEQYEEDRLNAAFVKHAGKSASEILEGIKVDMQQFVSGAEQHDDQTLIIMKSE